MNLIFISNSMLVFYHFLISRLFFIPGKKNEYYVVLLTTHFELCEHHEFTEDWQCNCWDPLTRKCSGKTRKIPKNMFAGVILLLTLQSTETLGKFQTCKLLYCQKKHSISFPMSNKLLRHVCFPRILKFLNFTILGIHKLSRTTPVNEYFW